MAASRKLYRNVADSFKWGIQAAKTEHERELVIGITRQVAVDFKADNSSFRSDLFYVACGLNFDGSDPK